jgi:hypothetical protein
MLDEAHELRKEMEALVSKLNRFIDRWEFQGVPDEPGNLWPILKSAIGHIKQNAGAVAGVLDEMISTAETLQGRERAAREAKANAEILEWVERYFADHPEIPSEKKVREAIPKDVLADAILKIKRRYGLSPESN